MDSVLKKMWNLLSPAQRELLVKQLSAEETTWFFETFVRTLPSSQVDFLCAQAKTVLNCQRNPIDEFIEIMKISRITGLVNPDLLSQNALGITPRNQFHRDYIRRKLIETKLSITTDGEDSLAHLCQHPVVVDKLEKRGIRRIPDLRRHLETLEYHILGIGPKRERALIQALEEYDQERVKKEGEENA